MARNNGNSGEAGVVAAFMQPYAKEFRRLEKKKHKASDWNDRATLRAQRMGGTAGQTENAKKAQAASEGASAKLDEMSIKIMEEYHVGYKISSLPEMHYVIANKEWGTGKKIEELGKDLTKEKHTVAGYIKLPVSIIGLVTLVFCAITGYFAAAGIILLIGISLVLGIAGIATDLLFSKRERALAIWEKAAARVKGLVESGNGDDAMNEVVEEKAVEDGLLDGISMN